MDKKEESKNLEVMKKRYGFDKADAKWIPGGGEILKCIGVEVIMVEFNKGEKGWTNKIKKAYIISISDYDPMTSTYLCKYRLVDEDKETSWREVRIIPEAFSFENPEETRKMIRFVPYSLHCKMAEEEAMYYRVSQLFDSRKTLPIENLKQISESKEQEKTLTYACNIAAVIKTIDDQTLYFRINKLNLRHNYKDNYLLTLTDEWKKAYTIPIIASEEEYVFKFNGDKIGLLKIIDLED